VNSAKTDASGFSLIEALAALALTATILMAIAAVAGQWLPNWNRGFVKMQQADLMGIGIEFIARDVSAAEYITRSADEPAPLFEGDATSVTFIRSAIGPDAYPRLEVVRIAQGEDDRGPAVLRTRQRFAPGAPFAFRDPVALVRAPLRISFAYAGPDRVWVASWKGQRRLPDAVRIEIRDAANPVLATTTAVRLKITAPGTPPPEAQSNVASGQPAATGSPRGSPTSMVSKGSEAQP
jgi:general secretion pathway protein J